MAEPSNDPSFILTIMLAIIGWALTTLYFFLSRRKLKVENIRLSEKVETLQETKFIGTFPNYFQKVVELINGAESNIQITTPVQATGYISSEKHWLKYNIALLNQKDKGGVELTIVCYDKSRRIEYTLERFGEEKFWSDGKRERINKLLNRNDNFKTDINTLLSLLEENHKKFYDSLFSSFDVKFTNKPIKIYSWIIDLGKRPQAIFAIPNYDKESSEVAFHTKDIRLIHALKAISDELYNENPKKNIRPLHSSVYEGRKIISETSLDFLRESEIVYTLGTIDALEDGSIGSYKAITSEYISNYNNVYFRVANFGVALDNGTDVKKLRSNIDYFLSLMKSGAANLEIYHNSEIARGVDDFHFRINQDKVVIRIGGKNARKNSAIVIPDKNVKNNFVDYYKGILANHKSKKLEVNQLMEMLKIIDENENERGQISSLSMKMNSYLNELPIRTTFDSKLEKKNVVVKVQEITNLSDSELADFRRVFNRYGFAILCLKNSEVISKYYEKDGIKTLDRDMNSLCDFFGEIYLHERSNNNRVDIKPGQILNSAFMGTTKEMYPAHVDGIYDDTPPLVVTLFSFEPSRSKEGESTVVSGKLIYDFIKKNYPEYISEFFNHEFRFVRGEKETHRAILSRLAPNDQIRISYRNDREVKIMPPEDTGFQVALNHMIEYVQSPSNIFSVYLEQGQLLVLDNTAVLHGRKGFEDTGRWLCRYSFMGKRNNNLNQFFFGIPENDSY